MQITDGKISFTSRITCRAAFALSELLIAIGIIVLLSGVLLAVLAQARSVARSVQCMANLSNISVAFSQYAIRNDDRYPAPLETGQSWESLLERYIQEPMVFACPADQEIFPSVGSSYDWRDTSDPATTLAGRRLVAVTRVETILAFETLSGWHQKHRMNALRVSGAIETLDDDVCLTDLYLPVNTGVSAMNVQKIHGVPR